ncbi:DEKNAAC100649 [Brettanomyces naardenensis]|uniref:Golgi apparatus membrane protein TVP38 n=1 Tax=Brettanomyces naardenensis TaxID=13370 RepID=A0A448YGE5_BRENA|nr:DEKNAAC100649 [Brettanomyces naardenensis]
MTNQPLMGESFDIEEGRATEGGTFSLTAVVSSLKKFGDRVLRFYNARSPAMKVLMVLACCAGLTFEIWFLIHYQLLIEKMVEASDVLYTWGFKGALLLFIVVFVISFPPCVGFNFCGIFIGMTYGWKGWPLLASASVLGSTCAFIPFKYILRRRAIEMMEQSENLKVFMDVMNDDDASYWENLLVLVCLRLSPLPYSFSNGAMGAIPGISVSSFAFASAITSPKLLLQLFTGIQLKMIADHRNNGLAKFIKFVSIAIATIAFTAATYIIFSKMKAKMIERHRFNGGAIGLQSEDENQEAST